MTWKSSLAPSVSRGRKPSSSIPRMSAFANWASSQSRRSTRRPLPSCVYPLSRPRRSFLSGPPHVANRGNDIVGPIADGRRAHAQSRKNFVLRPETFRRSNPQLRGYQIQSRHAVGAPALRTEIVSCSTPKLHRARTRKPGVNKHSLEPAARRNASTAPPRALR